MFLLDGLFQPIARLSSVLFAHSKRARDSSMHYPVSPENPRESQRGPLSDLYYICVVSNK
jgi:hypothetical protein